MLVKKLQFVFVLAGLCVAQSNVAKRNTTLCTFELGYCGWTNDNSESTYSEDFLRYTGHSFSYGTPVDHTFGTRTGYYLSLTPTNAPSSTTYLRKARLTSSKFNPAEKYCIGFYYVLAGVNAHTLRVYIKEYAGLGYPIKTITPEPSSKNVHWRYTEVEIDSEYTSTEFQIVFEGSVSSTRHYSSSHYYYSETDQKIGVDDIYVTNTGCGSVSKVPEGSKLIEDGPVRTYLYFNATPTTWSLAVDSCRKQSPFGHLVSIESEDKQKTVVQYIQGHLENQAAAEHGGVWTSGSDSDTEGGWVWTNTNQVVNYTDWKAGQPNNVGNRQDCLALDYPTQAYSWGDEYCELKKAFVCQMSFNRTMDHQPQIIG